MIKVGILGSVGSGKSFVANIFKELGFNIFSADQVVSQIYERNKNINKKISIFFKLKLNRGKINKNELRDTLKKNPKKFKYLNKIIHPIVRKKLILFLSKYKKTKLVVLDIPLLIENKMFNFVDIFIFVKTKPNIFKIRILFKPFNLLYNRIMINISPNIIFKSGCFIRIMLGYKIYFFFDFITYFFIF